MSISTGTFTCLVARFAIKFTLLLTQIQEQIERVSEAAEFRQK